MSKRLTEKTIADHYDLDDSVLPLWADEAERMHRQGKALGSKHEVAWLIRELERASK